MKRLSLHAVFLSLLLFAAGCSMATLAYNNAGLLVGFAVGDYADLTDEQEAMLRDKVARLIAWHRASELPQWLKFVQDARQRAAQAPTEADVREVYVGMQALLARTAEAALPDLAEALRTMDPVQVGQLQAKLARDNAKIAKEAALPAAERRAKRALRMRDRFRDWMGPLTDEQLAHLEARMVALPPLEEMRLADRERWQRELVKLLLSRPEPAVLQAELRVLILQPETRRHPAYQAEWSRQQQEAQALTAWMLAHATPAQRARVQKKLQGYADDIASLLR